MLTDEQVKEIKLRVAVKALAASMVSLSIPMDEEATMKLLTDITQHVEVEEENGHVTIAYKVFDLMKLPPYYAFIPGALQVPMVAAEIELFVVQNFGRKSAHLVRRM